MMAGASGTGKTTLCNHFKDVYSFISGSVSDLLPDTKDIPHKDMLARPSNDLVREDYQILNLRNKIFSQEESFISDRSFLDSAAYFLYKQADKLPQCEVEQFLDLCRMCLSRECTHLIYLPFTMTMFNEWVTEDNGKRITSRYFQMEISRIMAMVLDIWGYKTTGSFDKLNQSGFKMPKYLTEGWKEGEIVTPYGTTKILVLKEVNLQNRIDIIKQWLRKNS